MRPLPARVDHFVVGAGFAGLAMAVRLEADGERDFIVCDKADQVGGTWRANTYPGAACDVPSQLYSLSFAPNPEWSSSFSPQPEILAYLQRVARDSGTLDRFHFNTELLDASWDDLEQLWRISTNRGEVLATTLVTGSGGLSEPKAPDIEGIDDFQGALFHSAQWDHDVDLADKRVAVIGTGASAIQIVPELQRTVAHLDLYQRTPPWVIPRTDRRYSRLERQIFRRLPGSTKIYRVGVYLGRETYVPAFTGAPVLAAPAKAAALLNIRRAISDPALRAKVTPNYRLGCKRVLISNTYYPALAAPNVDLVTDPIIRVTPTGIVTADGVERPVDVIVVATGFHTTAQPIAEQITGRDGRTLAQTWAADGMAAHKGTTVHGFPNLFQLVGPNTTLGHSSMVYMIESQVRYVSDALALLRRRPIGAMEPRPEAQAAWNLELQQRLQSTVWNAGGCASWYLDEHGRNTTVWPRSTFTFRRLLSSFDEHAYRLHPRRRATDQKEVPA